MSEEGEEGEEGPIMIEKIDTQSEEREEGPTSIDVTDNQISIGEAPAIVLQEEKVQEQNIGIEHVQEESRISKMKPRRSRTTSYLTNISKQVKKNGNQINKVVMMVQSLQKQRQTKPITGAGESRSQVQFVKQIKSQISQLQKQVTRIQRDIQKIRTATVPKTRFRKLSTIKPRSKRGKSPKSTKVKKGRRSG